ncbi:MAG: bifunctional 4-hydroxy-3-methylbut-2-enyl diphosphate reductase/30S ribosomal protein S1 [Clostridia bacterium]|nr:bifunctional 4-hydroxy-3-methylbut-2-enyl diphosphate reductase/30S ribosomal protein S1 [Clostridia bacterium]
MEIIVAKTAGFCFGVKKAVDLAYDLVGKVDRPIYTLGPIIHNEQVVNQLRSKGVNVVNHAKEVVEDSYVVIRAHGVSADIYNELSKKKLVVEDATCPYVKKIQNLVKEKYEEGYQIIIVGDKEHPEVIGINGWCNKSAIIVNDIHDAQKIEPSNKKVCVVAQTTITNEKWESINIYLNKIFDNVIKFDTICSATSKRQCEAEEIAKSVDVMLVVGGKNSSNTQKLYEICKKHCERTYQIETSGDLPPVGIKKIKKIGITAGASTPDWVIKEVIEKMEELNKQDNEMSFKEAFESSLVTLETGQIVKGKIIGFNNAEVFVDMGFKSDGIIPIEEFTDDPEFNPEKSLKVGETVEVFVIRVNDGEGNVLLSKKKVDSISGFTKLEEAFENKAPIKAKIVDVVNGGVIAVFSGIRIFIPASQVSDRYVKELSEFNNKIVNLRLIEYNKQKKKFVGSVRVILEEEKAKQSSEIWSNIEVGKRYKGVVKSLMDFGAFVDIGGVDGLVHVSELSWGRIKNPSEVLKVGDTVEVSILEFDREKKKISLGYKKPEDNPWVKASKKYNVGDVVKTKVVRIVPFGAFVELDEGIDGLVHISQISNVRIGKADEVLKIGQEVEAKITEFNLEAKKISLSIKEVNPIDPAPKAKEAQTAEEAKTQEEVKEHKEDLGVTLGDLAADLKETE